MARKPRSRKARKPAQTPKPKPLPKLPSPSLSPEENDTEHSSHLGWTQAHFPGSDLVDKDLWKRWLAIYDVQHADIPLEETAFEEPDMAASGESKTEMTLSVDQQEGTYKYLIDHTIESIIHDILLDVHTSEKTARMTTAAIEVQQRAEKLGHGKDSTTPSDEPVETKSAIYKSPTSIQLKDNPMKTIKHIRCPNCKLLRLMYPRVGYNSKPVPDPTQQYCKSEPMIILDRHDVHGQRKKGVKVKGQPKNAKKNKRGGGADPASPAASENSDPLTPSSSILENQSFDFKEIDFPAAKCPNRDSHLGDHWKSVNVFATHLNGSCYLKRDRAAGREAREKLSGTPKDSRANSPKPTTAAAVNGVKRKAANDDDGTIEIGSGKLKKKAKTTAGDGMKKGVAKKTVPGAPSKLREQQNTNDDEDEGGMSTDVSPVKQEMNGDTIQVTPKQREQSGEPSIKLKFSAGTSTGTAKKKPGKAGKKA